MNKKPSSPRPPGTGPSRFEGDTQLRAYAESVQRQLRPIVPSAESPQDMQVLVEAIRSGPQSRSGGASAPDGSKEQTMSSNLYVGNLTYSTTSADLERLFAEHGEVSKSQVITDRETGRSRGFGFVEMETSEGATKAIEALDGYNVDGRALTVNVAKERSR